MHSKKTKNCRKNKIRSSCALPKVIRDGFGEVNQLTKLVNYIKSPGSRSMVEVSDECDGRSLLWMIKSLWMVI